MNIKHARLLRRAADRYIARALQDTPAGMTADPGAILVSADRMVAVVLELWPKLNAGQRARASLRLDAGLNETLRSIVAMTEGK